MNCPLTAAELAAVQAVAMCNDAGIDTGRKRKRDLIELLIADGRARRAA